MRVKTKLLMIGIYGLALVAACAVVPAGCSAHSSINGRETWGIGFMQIREGKGDTNYSLGAPAENESQQTHLRASEADSPSASIQAVYNQKGGR